MSELFLCRLCGRNGHHKLDILDNNQPTTPITLREKIFACVGVRVQRVGELTTKMCKTCYFRIIDFHDFRQKCIATDNRLNSPIEMGGNHEATATHNNSVVEYIDLTCDQSSPCQSFIDGATTSAFSRANFNSTETDDANQVPSAIESRIEEIPDEAQNDVELFDVQVMEVDDFSNCSLLMNGEELARNYNMNVAQVDRKPFKCPCPCSSCKKTCKGAYAFDCPICGQKFKYKSRLDSHVAKKHGQGIRYWCYLCNEPKFDIYVLKRHMNLRHTGQSLFYCPQCGRGFGAKGVLKTHMTTH